MKRSLRLVRPKQATGRKAFPLGKVGYRLRAAVFHNAQLEATHPGERMLIRELDNMLAIAQEIVTELARLRAARRRGKS